MMEEKIQEWIKADKEGRLVILPFAPGTTLYQIVPKCNGGPVCPHNEGCGLERCGNIRDAKCDTYIKEVSYKKPVIDIHGYYTSEQEAQQFLDQIKEAEKLIARAKDMGYV